MDRFLDAKYRIRQLMQVLEDAGFDINDPWSFQSLEVPDYIRFATGATRLVVWDEENPDYVAKIALAVDDEKYNQHEVELYRAAVEAGLEEHFAWCEEIYCYGERSVYAMEYLECNYDDIDSESYEWGFKRYCSSANLDPNSDDSREKYGDVYWQSADYEELVLDWFEDKLIKPIAAKFDSFIYEYEISDVHPGNIGRRNGQLVLCDYAGYGW